jgi:hypothetical protein
MRLLMIAAALGLSLTTPSFAQTAPAGGPASSPSPSPDASPVATPFCEARQAPLGAMGRAMVVAFTGPVFGARVCATFANVAFDGFTARIADATSADAVVTAALTDGGGLTLPLEGATVTGAGPYVVAPGGVLPSFGGDTVEAQRVVIAYAGQRVLVIATTPVALVDLARALRDHPGLFDADAVERAVVIASGPGAVLSMRTADGTLGAPAVTTPRVLLLIKRG